MRSAFAASCLALSLAAGCGEDDRPATWSYVHEVIIKPSCTTSSCHNSTVAVGALRLHSPEAAYAILVGRPCDGLDPPGEAPGNFVWPQHGDASRLVQLMRGDETLLPMPPDRLLPFRDVELVVEWIDRGALCD